MERMEIYHLFDNYISQNSQFSSSKVELVEHNELTEPSRKIAKSRDLNLRG